MKKYLYGAIIATFVMFLSSCNGTKTSSEPQPINIRDFSLPESAFPDSVTWDPHPPEGDSESCGINSNLFVTQDTGIVHCFCSRMLNMPDSISQFVTSLLTEFLYHYNEIGIFIFEFQDTITALNGLNYLRDAWDDTTNIFLRKQVFDLWIWCDSENDITKIRDIKSYYIDNWGFHE